MKKHQSRKFWRLNWRVFMGGLGFLSLTASMCSDPVNNQDVEVWDDADLAKTNINLNTFVPGDNNQNQNTIVDNITKKTFDTWSNDNKTHVVFVGSAVCPFCRISLQGDVTISGGIQEFIKSQVDNSGATGKLQWLPSEKPVAQNSDEKLVANEPFRGPFTQYANDHKNNSNVQFDVFYDTGLIDEKENKFAPIDSLTGRNDTQWLAFNNFVQKYISNDLITKNKATFPNQDGGWESFGDGIPIIFAYKNGEIIHHVNGQAEKGKVAPILNFYDTKGEGKEYYIDKILDPWLSPS